MALEGRPKIEILQTCVTNQIATYIPGTFRGNHLGHMKSKFGSGRSVERDRVGTFRSYLNAPCRKYYRLFPRSQLCIT